MKRSHVMTLWHGSAICINGLLWGRSTCDLQILFHRVSKRLATKISFTLQWRHNERDGVSNHQPHHCLLNRLFRHRSKKTPKLRVTGLCVGNSPVTGEFPAQRASNAENVSIWWRNHDMKFYEIYDVTTSPSETKSPTYTRYIFTDHLVVFEE